MKTKEKLVELLEANRGIYFSGEDIAQKLSVSRAAVWKAVKTLENEGYSIEAVPSKGYCLSLQTDILSAQGIRKYLRSEIRDWDISVRQTVSSTNSLVKEMANCGAPEGCMVLANEQTAGRGRMGRSFFSPQGTGVYMSLLLRPKDFSPEQAVRITTMAAVAMCEAIEAVSDEKAEIKWVNDVFVRGKKVCGILTEGSFGLENGLLEYVVLGIGTNLYEPENGFQEEIKAIAGTVFQTRQSDAKNRLTAAFLNHFYTYYTASNPAEYVEKYRSRSFAIGKEVTLMSARESKNAVVLGVDDHCRLLVQYADGTEDCFSSGEISIRF